MATPLPQWFRIRGYPHFDKPVSHKKAEPLITSPDWVKKHSFYPLISFTVVTKKIAKDNITGKASFKPPKERKISYASHIDSLVYSYYAEKLSLAYEAELINYDLTKEIIAFRSLKKSNIDFANDAFEEIKRRGNCSAIALDITGFFDNIDHGLLKISWKKLLGEKSLPEDHFSVFKSITNYSSVPRTDLFAALEIPATSNITGRDGLCSAKDFRTKVRSKGIIIKHKDKNGIPQGSPISALLSNIYMLPFDIEIKKIIDDVGGTYYRYCDDILIIVSTEYEKLIESYASKLISNYKLEINEKKTETTTFLKNSAGIIFTSTNKPMQYLGFTFDGQQKLIRSAAFAKFSHKMKRGVSLAKQTARKHNKIRRRNGQAPHPLYKKSLYERYSHLGQKNFITYGHRAAKKMQSKEITRQLKPLWERLNDEINRTV